jgi:hypothetical protein
VEGDARGNRGKTREGRVQLLLQGIEPAFSTGLLCEGLEWFSHVLPVELGMK